MYLRKHFRVVHSSPFPYSISYHDFSGVDQHGDMLGDGGNFQNVVEITKTRSGLSENSDNMTSKRVDAFRDEMSMKGKSKEYDEEGMEGNDRNDYQKVMEDGNGKEGVEGSQGNTSTQQFEAKKEEGEVKLLAKGNDHESMMNAEDDVENIREVFEDGDEKGIVQKFNRLNFQFSKWRKESNQTDNEVVMKKKQPDGLAFSPTFQSALQRQQHDVNITSVSIPNNHSMLGEEKLGIIYYSMQTVFFESSSIQSGFLQQHHSYSSLIHHLQPEQDWSLRSSHFFQASTSAIVQTSHSSLNTTQYHHQTDLLIQSLQQIYSQTNPFPIPPNQSYHEGGVPNRHAPWLYLKNVCLNPKSMVFTVYQDKPVQFPTSCM